MNIGLRVPRVGPLPRTTTAATLQLLQEDRPVRYTRSALLARPGDRDEEGSAMGHVLHLRVSKRLLVALLRLVRFRWSKIRIAVSGPT